MQAKREVPAIHHFETICESRNMSFGYARAQLTKIAIKWRLQKWCLGAGQIHMSGESIILQVFVRFKMRFGWHESTTYEHSHKM